MYLAAGFIGGFVVVALTTLAICKAAAVAEKRDQMRWERMRFQAFETERERLGL